MKRAIRAVVFNTDQTYAAQLRADLLSAADLQIVAEVDEPSLLLRVVEQFPAEIVVVHLDPGVEPALGAAKQIAERGPAPAVIVVSGSTEGQHVLAAMRAGIREFLPKPIDRQWLAKAVEKIAAQQSAGTKVGTIVSVVGTIGGVGASSLAVNLATELNDICGRGSVALVDLDFRYGQLATMLDLHADHTIADLCGAPEQIDATMIRKVMVRHSTGVELLARPNLFDQASQMTAADSTGALNALQQMYTFVVADGPNRFDPGGLAVIDLANFTLLLIQLLVTSVRNAHRMLQELRAGGYSLDRFRLVCNRVGRDSGHLDIADVEKTLEMKIARQVPDEWKTMSEMIDVGTPLIQGAPKSKVRSAIRELAEELAHPEREAADTAGKKTGLLGKMFRAAS